MLFRSKSAADAMRAEVSNMTLNTIFLKNPAVVDANVDPQDFLVKLTGSADRVKVAADADSLTSEILDLKAPPVDLDTTTAQAILKADGVEDQMIGFAAFAPADGLNQVWTFRTEEFKAFPGKDKQSSLAVSAVDSTGQKYELDFTISPRASE